MSVLPAVGVCRISTESGIEYGKLSRMGHPLVKHEVGCDKLPWSLVLSALLLFSRDLESRASRSARKDAKLIGDWSRDVASTLSSVRHQIRRNRAFQPQGALNLQKCYIRQSHGAIVK